MISGRDGDDLRLDGEPVAGRRLDDREVAQARERQVQRARDRGRRHRQHVDRGLPLLQALLLRDAEPLLLVHDQQAQVPEREVLAEHAVRRDEDVDGPVRDARDDVLLLRARAEAREQLDRDGKGGEPPLEGAEVLVGEDRRRRQHGDLLAVEDRLEGGAHGDLRLAVADVAAQQPVHGLLRLHVPLDVGDRLRLVGRFDVLEGVLELLLPGRVLGEREPFGEAAPRVELQELVGHVAHGLAHRGLAFGPAGAAQPVERGLDAFDARVLLHEIQALDRQQQRARLGVLDLHELALLPLDRNALQSLEAADAVVRVHDGVAELQVPEVGEKRFARLAARGGRAPLLAEDLFLGVERQARLAQPESGRELRGDGDDDARVALRRDVESVLEGQALQLLDAARGPRGDEDLLAGLERLRQVRRRLGRAPRVPGDRLGGQPDPASARGLEAEPVEAQRNGGEPLADPSDRMHELLGRKRVPVRIPVRRQALVEAGDFLLDGGRLEDHGQRSGGVIEPARGHRRDRRREHAALGLRRRTPDPLGHRAPRLFRLLGRRKGRQPDFLQLLLRALRVRVEEPQRRDRVALELDAHRQVPVRREDVEEAAAHGEVAGLDHQIGAVIPEARQPPDDAGQRDFRSHGKVEEQFLEPLRVRQPHEQRARRQHGGPVAGAAAQRRQQRELVAPRLEGRRDALVRRERRRGSVEDALHAARGEIADQALGLLLVRDDDRQRPLEVPRERREQDRGQGADAPRHDQAVFSPADPGEQVRVRGKAAGEVREHWVMPGRGVYRTPDSPWSCPSSQSMHARCWRSWLAR